MNTKLLERLDARLREFISTEEVPYGGGLMGDGYEKPQFPNLHLSRSTDPGLMKLPGKGNAVVRYRVKSRNIDESRDDGQPLYGASIEIQSLEPVADGGEFERRTSNVERRTSKELEETVFLREFGGARNAEGGTRKEFGRDRDDAGRFAAGRVPGPGDYALAGEAARKRNRNAVAAAVAGAGALTAGGAMLVNHKARQSVRKTALKYGFPASKLARAGRGQQVLDAVKGGAQRVAARVMRR